MAKPSRIRDFYEIGTVSKIRQTKRIGTAVKKRCLNAPPHPILCCGVYPIVILGWQMEPDHNAFQSQCKSSQDPNPKRVFQISPAKSFSRLKALFQKYLWRFWR